MADEKTAPFNRTPTWVKVQAALVLLLILVVAAMTTGLIGSHGHDYAEAHGREQHMGGH